MRTHIKGEEGEYTGETQFLHGGLFHNVRMLTGPFKGQIMVTQRGPDGSDPHAAARSAAWKQQQAEFYRLHETK